MNTVLFSRLLARNLSVGNPSRLTADEAIDVLAAINAGLQQFFAEAPARFKRRTVSRFIIAPSTAQVSVDEEYATTLSAGSFDIDRQLGCTLEIPGAVSDNQVAGVSELLDPWTSPDQTDVEIRVFSDALPIDAPVERLTSDVVLYVTGRAPAVLVRDQIGRRDHEEGTPRFYDFEARGEGRTEGAPVLLRLWPLPDAVAIVRFTAEFAPVRVTFRDLVTPAELQVPDELSENILLPLCAAHLTDSPLWANPATITRTLARATEVLETKIPLLARDAGVPDNTVGTPEGF